MQHLDEGTIHAWLDGQLPQAEAEVVESHVASCRPCADAVAEARGLIAASSRILTMLDDVPRGVVPHPAGRDVGEGESGKSAASAAQVAAAGGAVGGGRVGSTPTHEERSAVDDLAARRARREPRRWFTAPRLAAAAVLVVAVGTFAVTRSATDRATAELQSSSTIAGDAGGGAGASEARSADRSASQRSVAGAPASAAPSAMPVPAMPAPAGARAEGAQPPAAARERAERDMAADVPRDVSRPLAANEARLRNEPAVLPPPPPRRADSVAVQVYRGPKTEVTRFEKATRGDSLAAMRTTAAADTARRAVAGAAIARVAAESASADSARVRIRGPQGLAAAAPQPTGLVRGRVTQVNGGPIAEAQVTVDGTALGTMTDASGAFVLRDVPAGTQQLRVRRIGFAVGERSVLVQAGQTITTEVSIAPSALSLSEVVVTGSGVQEARDDARQRRRDAQQMAPRTAAQGTTWPFGTCYDLGITAGPGTPSTGFLEIPRRIALDSVPAAERNDGLWYRVRDLGPARAGVATRAGVWRPGPPDAVEIEWSAGTRTAHVRLTGSPDSPMLRGSLQDIDRAAGTGVAAAVVAAKRGC